MKNRSALSSPRILLIELLMAILIFTVAAAICLRIFVAAHNISVDSGSLNHAVIAAQNGAECYKAARGDIFETAELLRGDLTEDKSGVDLYFSKEWSEAARDNYTFIMEIRKVFDGDGIIDTVVNVRNDSGELIFSIPVTVSPGSGVML